VWLGPSTSVNRSQTRLNDYVPYKWVKFLLLALFGKERETMICRFTIAFKFT